MACLGQGVWWDQLFTLALQRAGAPASRNNLDIVERWATWECTAATYNPLATTSYEPNSPCFNSVCVRNYPSVAVGADGTAITWMNGYYPALLAALRRDAPLGEWSCTPIPAELDTWGTRGFATWLRNAHGCPQPGCNPPCTGGATCVNGTCVPPQGCTPPCTGGATCVGNSCQCPAGTAWNGSQCVPVVPPPSPAMSSLLPVALLLGAAGVGYWQAQRHREATSAILHDPVPFGSGRHNLRLPHLSAGAPAPRGRATRTVARGFGD